MVIVAKNDCLNALSVATKADLKKGSTLRFVDERFLYEGVEDSRFKFSSMCIIKLTLLIVIPEKFQKNFKNKLTNLIIALSKQC